MANTAVHEVSVAQSRTSSLARDIALIVGASLLMDVLGRFSVPLPFTPVPLTLANFGVLLIALTIGSRRAAAAMLLYLAEGAMGMPVFSPVGLGGIAQILGVTGGYLMSYPVAAFVAGWIAEHGSRNILRSTVAALSGEALVFLGGILWLALAWHAPVAKAAAWGIYPFAFAEIIKIMAAVAGSTRLHRSSKFAGLLA
jgi:biotin transport system substrate-specific component